MKSKIIFILIYIVLYNTVVFGQAGVEQYYYVQGKEPVEFVPIVSFETGNNWYAEARYNYEDKNTFSLYGGRKFSGEYKRLMYSLTPIVGVVTGDFQGGSAGVNTTVELKKLFFSSQSQYTFSTHNPMDDFFFSWSEAGYEIASWFYLGLSVQHTQMLHANTALFEHGAVIGFEFGRWSIPIYSFNTFDNSRYFVLGINLGIETSKKTP
jgi:hypothetical protein